ncbi:hypothetical protein ACFXPY_44530 [Streptomyces sp. NPDC059153]
MAVSDCVAVDEVVVQEDRAVPDFQRGGDRVQVGRLASGVGRRR